MALRKRQERALTHIARHGKHLVLVCFGGGPGVEIDVTVLVGWLEKGSFRRWFSSSVISEVDVCRTLFFSLTHFFPLSFVQRAKRRRSCAGSTRTKLSSFCRMARVPSLWKSLLQTEPSATQSTISAQHPLSLRRIGRRVFLRSARRATSVRNGAKSVPVPSTKSCS